MIRLPLVLTIALALPAAAQARDYGQQGAVFPVIERDLLEQIHSRLVALAGTAVAFICYPSGGPIGLASWK